MMQVMHDSRLAILQSTSFENLEMFHDQQALCDWIHDAVAMHPFTTPSEMQKEAVPVSNVIRTLLAEPFNESLEAPTRGPDNRTERRLVVSPGEGKLWYDAMKAGKSSGFDISWLGITNSKAMSSKRCRWS